MERLVIAYTLIGIMVAVALGAIAYAIYNSPERRYSRDRMREKKMHAARVAKGDSGHRD